MRVTYTPKARAILDRKMAELKGRGAKIAADAIAEAIEQGNRRDRLAGVDRYGRTLAPIKGKRPNGASGPPLVPHNLASRAITRFRAEAHRLGGLWKIVAGWTDATFLAFHATGTSRLPVRNIFGCSPQTWAEIRKAIAAFKDRVRRA